MTYRQGERLAKVSERSLQRWRAEDAVRWREGERGRVELLLEDVRRVKREKARKNVPLQRRVEKAQAEETKAGHAVRIAASRNALRRV